MKKRKILTAIVVVLVLLVPFTIFAATSDSTPAKAVRGFLGIDVSKLNDQQKADISDYKKKMADLQKEFIDKMVADGVLTADQGKAAAQRIDDMLKNGRTDMLPGPGMGEKGFAGLKNKGDFGIDNIDTSKLTDQQKKDLLDSIKKVPALDKEFVGKMVSNGLLTQAQADTINKKLDTMAQASEQSGLSKGLGSAIGGFGGINWFGMAGYDSAKLTDQQKADLKDYSQKKANIQKEIIGKLVSDNLITKAQGDTLTGRIDSMQQKIDQKGFVKGPIMRKGHMGRRSWQGNTNGKDSTNESGSQSASGPAA